MTISLSVILSLSLVFSSPPPDSVVTSDCDSIITLDGQLIIGEIGEVSKRKIYYKECASENYLLKILKRKDVDTIISKNDYFNDSSKQETKTKRIKAKTPIMQTLMAVLLGVLVLLGFIYLIYPLVN